MASKSTIQVLDYLKQQTEPKTHKEIQEALGFAHVASVVGATTSFAKKGYITKTEVTVGDKTVKAVQITEEGRNVTLELDADKPKDNSPSEKAKDVIKYLQAHQDANVTAADIAAEYGVLPIAINGTVNGMVKKGLAYREDSTVELPDGTTKTVKFIKLTPDGLALAL